MKTFLLSWAIAAAMPIALGACTRDDADERTAVAHEPAMGDDPEVDACLDQARAQVGASPDETRLLVEIAVARCTDPTASEQTVQIVGQINADLARAAADVAEGRIPLALYASLSGERSAKLSLYMSDPSYADDLAAGDQDADLVPDARDACPDTAPRTPTDASGCDLRGDVRCPSSIASCAPNGGESELIVDDGFSQLLDGTTVMFNAACEGAPTPAAPTPIAWGRGGGGYNVAVSKVPDMPPGCDLFYQVEMRFTRSDGTPVYTTALFDAREDKHRGDATRATFGVAYGAKGTRGTLYDAFGRYTGARWRVRAVNGAQAASSWSAVRTQGPASGGVP